MKNLIPTLMLIAMVLPIPLVGQEPQNNPLTITLVGTNSYSEVSYFIKNLKRSSQVNSITASYSSRDLFEFAGSYHGDPKTLTEEIASLAQDRFSVEPTKQKDKTTGALAITLRKLAASTSSSY